MKGFTLLELLLVLVIIAIITSLLLPATAGTKLAAQKAACKANARTIQSLNLVGVPVVYAQRYPYPFASPFEGKRGYVDFKYGKKSQLMLFVNCFDCHTASDPFDLVHEFVPIY